jgi:hypothetical protein
MVVSPFPGLLIMGPDGTRDPRLKPWAIAVSSLTGRLVGESGSPLKRAAERGGEAFVNRPYKDRPNRIKPRERGSCLGRTCGMLPVPERQSKSFAPRRAARSLSHRKFPPQPVVIGSDPEPKMWTKNWRFSSVGQTPSPQFSAADGPST